MRTRPLFLAVALVSALALWIAGATVSSARYVNPAPAQSGRYGGLSRAHPDELIGFKVLPNRVVKAFFFQTRMECHNEDTRENYARDFDARNIGGGKVDFTGTWRREFTAESNGRKGRGTVEAHFPRSRPPFASATVFTTDDEGGLETCSGELDLPVRRGPLS